MFFVRFFMWKSLWNAQDNLGRLHEKSKEALKTMKQLTRLFPNKISIQSPQVYGSDITKSVMFTIWPWCMVFLSSLKPWQDEAELLDWKQQLDHDVETIKAKANILNIRSVSCSYLDRNKWNSLSSLNFLKMSSNSMATLSLPLIKRGWLLSTIPYTYNFFVMEGA